MIVLHGCMLSVRLCFDYCTFSGFQADCFSSQPFSDVYFVSRKRTAGAGYSPDAVAVFHLTVVVSAFDMIEYFTCAAVTLLYGIHYGISLFIIPQEQVERSHHILNSGSVCQSLTVAVGIYSRLFSLGISYVDESVFGGIIDFINRIRAFFT